MCGEILASLRKWRSDLLGRFSRRRSDQGSCRIATPAETARSRAVRAGLKERIDFGDDIGTYVTLDGASTPKSIGVLHYRADGSVHIAPGRPQ